MPYDHLTMTLMRTWDDDALVFVHSSYELGLQRREPLKHAGTGIYDS